jgi:nucleotide-binding universal stress UspA family protein
MFRGAPKGDYAPPVFDKVLHANDGSEQAFRALALALAIARRNSSEFHMVSVEEIGYVPEFIEEVRQDVDAAARRFHDVLLRARIMAEESHVESPYSCWASGAAYRRVSSPIKC